MKEKSYKMCYEQAAEAWNDALPLGNGRLAQWCTATQELIEFSSTRIVCGMEKP